MAIEKYIIDKSDLTALLRGEDLSIQPKGNIKGFCVEIAGSLTNGDMIKAMFPSVEVKEKNNGYEVYFGIGTASQYFNHQWWNALYEGGEDRMSKETTCKNCIYANECIMYEPKMKRCKDFKESENKE